MGFSKQVTVRKTAIGPFSCYGEGKDFLGSQYGLYLGICFVGLLIGGLIPVVLYGPAFAGIALCFITRARGERVEFDQLFKGFDYFVPSLIATLIYIGCTAVLIIPFLILIFTLMAMMASQNAILMLAGGIMLGLAYVGWILLIGIASMVFMFAILLIVDKGLEGPAAMKYAFEGLMKNFWGVLGTATAGQFMVFVGTLMCIVPGLLLIPILFAGHFIAYRKIFGVELAQPIVAQPVYYQ